MNNPIFSVVIPIYNKGPHIRRCIDSVLNQTFRDIEILLVNDPSTDGSADIVAEYVDSRIRVFQRDQPGPGGYAARNLGIRMARSQYIAFLDADDEWLPDHLKHMAELISQCESSAGFFSSGYLIFNGKNFRESKYYARHKNDGTHVIDIERLLKIYLEKRNRFCHTSVVVVKKDVILSMGGFPEGRTHKGGDLYTWIRIMSTCRAAWSPHTGAKVYHDSVNKVTKTAYFNPVLFSEMVKELESVLNERELYLLKSYVNNLLIKDYFLYKSFHGASAYSLIRYVYLLRIDVILKSVIIALTPGIVFSTLRKLRGCLK